MTTHNTRKLVKQLGGSVIKVAAGSVLGRDHVAIGKNNQDAFHISAEYGNVVTLIVCDGCGEQSENHSEVGASLATRMMAAAIGRQLTRYPSHEMFGDRKNVVNFMRRIKQDVCAVLRVNALSMGESLSHIVTNYFLFTIIGAVLTPDISFFFSLGDGVIFVNGERIQIGPWPKNEPPYLAYNIVDSTLSDSDPQLLDFQIHRIIATADLKSALLGTDGVLDFEAVAEKSLPKKPTIQVGPVSQFWEEGRYFENPSNVQRWLKMTNDSGQEINWVAQKVERQHGHLKDDTTLIALRADPAD